MTPPVGNSYWAIVGRQLRRNRLAMFGYRCVIGLFLLAIYAPVLASDRPFYYRGPEGREFPWFADLFDRIVVKQSVDLFFNLLMLFLPVGLAAYFGWRGVLRMQGRWDARAIRRTTGSLTAVFLWIYLGIYLPDSVVESPVGRVALFPGVALRSSKQFVDWHEREAADRKAGHEVTAVFPPVPYGWDTQRVREQTLPPDYFFGGKVRDDLGAVGKHPLGTDPGGRDVLAGLLYGTRISMTIGVIAVGIYVTIGIVLGSLAGYFGGWVDILISRFIEIMICFPTLFFVLAVVSVFEHRSIFLVMGVIGLTGWTQVSRLIRGEFLTQRNLEYTIAADALGLPRRRIIFRHVLPNSLTPVLVSATFGVAAAILVESSISFLGLGDPNAASWGGILNVGRNSNLDWVILPPGAAIFFTVTVFNLLGEGLRDALDPKLRQ